MLRHKRSAKLRILVLARVFPPRIGGIENYVYGIYSRLTSLHDVTIVTPAWPGGRSFDSKQDLRVIRSPQFLPDTWKGAPLLGMLLFGVKEVLLNRPDQIHCDQIDAAVIGRLLASMARVPYLVCAHGMEITDNSHARVKRWAAGKASGVIGASDYACASVLDYWEIPASCIYLVRPGVNVDRFHPAVDPTRVKAKHNLDGKKVILTIGRMAGHERCKGQDSIIRCMPVILDQVPEAKYLIVGDGPDRERLQTLAREQSLDQQVIFAGRVPDEELSEYYAACDVFAMPSREGRSKHGGTQGEGFGIVFVEANACGKPTVGTYVGGIPDAVIDGVTGLLVSPNDQNQLRKAIVTLLRDQALAKRLGEEGRKRAEQEFQWDLAAQKLSAIVNNLASMSLR